VQDLVGWVVSDSIKAGETVVDGLKNAPAVLKSAV